MKSILSLWALLSLVCVCNSMDRHRNKICYTAMTCIHTGKEKCGEDGGKFRRFYDSCDMLEFNCLKGKDYIKTAKGKCANLPPIDDGQEGKATGNDVNNDGNTGNGNENKGGIEGELIINDNGDVEGEVVVNDDVGTGAQVADNTEAESHDNTGVEGNDKSGIEGEVVVDDNGSIEGKIEVNDDVVEEIQAEDKYGDPENEDEDGLHGDINVNEAALDMGAENIPADDNTEIHVEESDEGGLHGDTKVNEGALDMGAENIPADDNTEVGEDADIGESGHDIKGEVVIDDKGNIEAEVEIGREANKEKQKTNMVTTRANKANKKTNQAKRIGNAGKEAPLKDKTVGKKPKALNN